MYLWRFYKKPETNTDDIPSSVTIYDKYPLYALTCEKKYAKRFMKERDMDKFIMYKSKIEKDEYADFANMNRSALLSIESLLTVENKHTETQKRTDVNILITTYEKQCCEEPYLRLNDEIWWGTCPPPSIFNESIMNALRYLDYNSTYKIMSDRYVMVDFDDDYSAPDYFIDELMYFIDTFGSLFKFK